MVLKAVCSSSRCCSLRCRATSQLPVSLAFLPRSLLVWSRLSLANALQRDILGRITCLDCSPLWVRHGSCVRHWSARSFPEWSCTLGVVSNPSAGPVRGNGRCLLQAGRLPVLPTQPWFPLAVFPTSPGFETQLVQRVNDDVTGGWFPGSHSCR